MDVDTHLASGAMVLAQVAPAELSPGEFAHRIRCDVNDRDIKLVTIDSLNGSLHAMPDERFLLPQLHALFMFLRQRGVLAVSMITKRSGDHERSIRELRMHAAGISLGPPLREFEGVLTGVPRFVGEQTLRVPGPQ